jgi:CheY-like chemotaxis protein
MSVAQSGATAEHWCFRIARQAGWPRADTLTAAAGMSTTDAWAAVTNGCGVTDETLATEIARSYRLHLVQWKTAEPLAAKLVPERLARKHLVFPVRDDYGTICLATADPNDLTAAEEVALASGRVPILQIGSPRAITASIEAGYAPASAAMGGPGEGADRNDAARRQPAPAVPRPRILVVDDDIVIRGLAVTLLSKEGFEVTEVGDGASALAAASTGPAFDLMILDLGLPRLDGREVLRRVRSEPSMRKLTVIILTQSADETLEAALMDEGADDYVRKPIDPARFLARVKAVLRRARQD